MCVYVCVVVQLVRESQRHCAVLVFELICIGELGSQEEKRKKDILATFPHEYTVLCPSSVFLQKSRANSVWHRKLIKIWSQAADGTYLVHPLCLPKLLLVLPHHAFSQFLSFPCSDPVT